MKVNILIQTLRQRRQPRSIPTSKTQSELDQEGLYYKDVAGFIIFLLVTFVFLMIAMHN